MTKLFAYSTTWQKNQLAGQVSIGHHIGYVSARSEDEARGVAVRKGKEVNSDYTMINVNVIEIIPEHVSSVYALQCSEPPDDADFNTDFARP